MRCATLVVVAAVVVVCGTGALAGSALRDRFHVEGIPDLTNMNFIGVKIPKCASSTTAGIWRRLVDHADKFPPSGITHSAVHSNWQIQGKPIREPGVWAHHRTFEDLKPDLQRMRLPYYLATFIRQPLTRALSDINWRYNRKSIVGTLNQTYTYEEYALFYFQQNYNRLAKYMCDIDTKKKDPAIIFAKDPDVTPEFTAAADALLTKCLGMYDFVGLTERVEESLIVLKHKLNCTYSSLLFTPAKVGGTVDVAMHSAPLPSKKKLSDLSQNIQDFVEQRWITTNTLDSMLWARVNEQLDRDLAAIGETRVHEELRQLAAFLKIAADKCTPEKFIPKLCYYQDNGCGYQCMDNIKEFFVR